MAATAKAPSIKPRRCYGNGEHRRGFGAPSAGASVRQRGGNLQCGPYANLTRAHLLANKQTA
jgi:hypothetical protein